MLWTPSSSIEILKLICCAVYSVCIFIVEYTVRFESTVSDTATNSC